MLVVDANIVVPLLITTPQTKETRTLYDLDSNWRTEPFALIEISQVLIKYLRAGFLKPADARLILLNANRLLAAEFLEIEHEEALAIAMKFNVSAYDARYLATAIRSQLPLITEDKRLRAAAPDLTLSLADAI